MLRVKMEQGKLYISAKIIYKYIKKIARKQFYRDKHILLESDRLDKANTKNTHFNSAKASAIADCRDEFRRLFCTICNI